MERYLKEIETALNAELYTIALISALSLPDICACLESPTPNDISKVGSRYKRWYNKYAKEKCSLSAENCYKYRCSMVHNVNSTLHKSPHEKVAFFLPGTSPAKFINTSVDLTYMAPCGQAVNEKALLIELPEFINGMIESVREWLKEMQDNKNFINNYKSFFQIRPISVLSAFGQGIAVY